MKYNHNEKELFAAMGLGDTLHKEACTYMSAYALVSKEIVGEVPPLSELVQETEKYLSTKELEGIDLGFVLGSAAYSYTTLSPMTVKVKIVTVSKHEETQKLEKELGITNLGPLEQRVLNLCEEVLSFLNDGNK